jgi:23S rRNA (uracil1939-C5)-methyltransferase
MSGPTIVLASRSPRRRELMANIAGEFLVYPVDIDESVIREKDPVRFAVEAAVRKARAGGEAFPAATVIGADTVVAVGPRLLGKPSDRSEARGMLQALSGKRHRVITGVAIYRRDENRLLANYELTWVTFRPLTEDMIDAYLERGDFPDKAGAYAVQDVGDAFVAQIKGDYDNVVGFPTAKVRALLERFRAPEESVLVEDLDLGSGLRRGRAGKETALLREGLPGDTVRARLVRRGRSGVWADFIRVETPSPSRVAPGCPHFGLCGGCRYQDLSYTEQLRFKDEGLRRTLRSRLGPAVDRAPWAPIAPSPDLYGYRNKMEFSFDERDGTVVLGLRERAAEFSAWQRTVPLEVCPIFGAAVEVLFPPVLEFVRKARWPAFDYTTRKGFLRHLMVREGKRTGELMLALVTTGEIEPDLGPLAADLAARCPGLQCIYHIRSDRVSDVVSFERLRLLAGVPRIEEKLGRLTFRIYPQTFFQTNTRAAELLYGRIAAEVAALKKDARVLGLYCGAGPIELFLAGEAGEVTGLDASPENIAAAVENAAANRVQNCRFIPGYVEKALRPSLAEAVDVLVLDPPRKGLTSKALRHVLTLNIPRIIYVSCNAEALARDLEAFAGRGYVVRLIAPFDFFPHTPQLETLAVLEKA